MRELLQETMALWQGCPASLPALPRPFTPSDQAAREERMERFLKAIQGELQRLPRTRAERDAARGRITAGFVEFARTAMELNEAQIQMLLGGGFSQVGTDLARRARRFDPRVTAADIRQASRNAWTACGLQTLLERPMRLTPAIFAYSMLYPYTDNYMDDPAIAGDAKVDFSRRFGKRLRGEAVTSANEREAAIWRLVGMIEDEHPRDERPRVYESLLAIHGAQERSLRLLRRGGGVGDVDVLGLSFEKGGASVLADGYLAAGTLTEGEARFVFGWGVLLQLADDLQDVEEDRRDGMLTLFSQAAGREPLDGLTSRTLHFAGMVMGMMRGLPGAGCAELTSLIQRSSFSLLIRSAGEAGGYYTPEYLAEMERHSPFRFAFLRERRRRMAERSGLLNGLFEAFLAGDEDEPAFPMLPSSLMPRL